MITFGIFLAAVFNYAAERHQSGKAASWQITLGLSFVPAAILAVGILGFSETPRYNFRHGKVDKATDTMVRVYGVPANNYSIQLELEEMREKLAAESNMGNPFQEWIGMWRAPKMAYRLALGMALQMFQQLTGANYCKAIRVNLKIYLLIQFGQSSTTALSFLPALVSRILLSHR